MLVDSGCESAGVSCWVGFMAVDWRVDVGLEFVAAESSGGLTMAKS